MHALRWTVEKSVHSPKTNLVDCVYNDCIHKGVSIMNPTERMINRIDTVEKFRDIAYLCEDFQTFVDEVQEWGVDHICGVDFFGKGFELNPKLDFKLLDEYFSSFGYTMDNPHPAGRFA